MIEAGWPIVGLTAVLIVVTFFYAIQTYRLADTASQDSRERQRRENEASIRIAVALKAEVEEVCAVVRELVPESNELAFVAGVVQRFLAKVRRLPGGRVFDGILTELAVLPTETVQAVVGFYGLLGNVREMADELLSRPQGEVAGFEFDQTKDDLKLLLAKAESSAALLQKVVQPSPGEDTP